TRRTKGTQRRVHRNLSGMPRHQPAKGQSGTKRFVMDETKPFFVPLRVLRVFVAAFQAVAAK
ncbi:MAG: hypothetical protein KDE24_22105, partial [Caldilinea sp.]|nr:hypothetical protein [Caldilinea sp.]